MDRLPLLERLSLSSLRCTDGRLLSTGVVWLKLLIRRSMLPPGESVVLRHSLEIAPASGR